ncbi:hypothetical protein DEJ44_16205 [Streptomyces venezuelae]|uniref:OsmC family protein n=1 Tax=Streptomyces venezuelae TaxID=54571 RepID=UPI001238B304|nr:hypothetical protein [Streptomyces venezuelae]QES07001.1 hypothetical protein DEJ44_16205 [Streptomyces venezuelae]
MLNGVDLPARRALAEQIREDSWEAQLSIGVQAHPEPGARCRVDTEPMRLGSTRVARSFSVHQSRGTGAADASPSCLDPVGSLLVALGASVADNVAASLTGEGCHLTLLKVLPVVESGGDGGRSRLSYALHIEGEVSPEEARRAALAARERSSGHRTLEEPNEIRVVVQTARDEHLTARPVPADPAPFTGELRRAAEVAWEVGAHVIAEVDGVRVESDQPKQLFGADLAPNAQEYVLSALAAEALRFAAPADADGAAGAAGVASGASAGAGDGGPAAADAVHASGRIDLRGPYSAQEAQVGLRNILVQLLPADPSAGDGSAAAAMRGWLTEGHALRLVRDAHPIHVELVLNGTPIAA